MPNATWEIRVDWDDDGTFGTGDEDITNRVLHAEWSLGTQREGGSRRFKASEAIIVLNNESGDYSSFNTSSPIAGNILPGRQVRIRATDGSGTETMWVGQIASLVPEPRINQANVATLRAVSPLTAIGHRSVQMLLKESRTTGEIVHDLLDSVNFHESYREAVTDDTPIGYWRFHETTGSTATDETARGNDGTITGATLGGSNQLPTVSWVTSFLFDGVSGDVDFGDVAAHDNLPASGFSLEFLMSCSSAGENNEGYIIDKGVWRCYVSDPSGGAVRLNIYHERATVHEHWQTTTRPIATNGTIYHVVITWSDIDSTPIIYVDDVSISLSNPSAGSGARSDDSGSNVLVGNRAADDRTFDGELSEIAIYDKVLTVAAIADHYAAYASNAFRDIDEGETTISTYAAADFQDNEQNLLNALFDVALAEGGLVYESRSGSVIFEDRDRRLQAPYSTSQATFSDASTTRTYMHIKQEDPLLSVYNIIPITVQLYREEASSVLWDYPATTAATAPGILPGETLTVWANYPNILTAPDTLVPYDIREGGFAVKSWVTPVATTDYVFNDTAGGGGGDLTSDVSVTSTSKFATSMRIEFTNNHASSTAYPTMIQARGVPILKLDPVFVQAEDSVSQASFQERTMPTNAKPRWIPTVAEAIDRSNWDLGNWKDPHPIITVRINANRDTTHLDEGLRRTISDRITLVADNDANLGINEDFFIEGEHHIVNSSLIHQVTWELAPVSGYGGMWILGTSKLGLDTRLHY